MTQLSLFNDYIQDPIIKQENKMTWNELYDFLDSQKVMNPALFDQHVVVHDIETGDEYPCDTTVFSDNNRLVLSINNE